MSLSVRIGTWKEIESRDIRQCPSHYAADFEVLRTVPGEYPAFCYFCDGYLVPMPQRLIVGIDANRIEGKLYSGFCGVTIGSRDLPKEPKKYTLRIYNYHIPKLIEDGRLVLDPEFSFLNKKEKQWDHPDAPKTWEDLTAIIDLRDRREGDRR